MTRLNFKRFLKFIRGGKTKVLISSRSPETWLRQELVPLKLGGLQGEERWAYFGAISARGQKAQL